LTFSPEKGYERINKGDSSLQDSFIPLEPEDLSPKLQMKIEELGLSLRAVNCCKTAKLFFVKDLVRKTALQLRSEGGFGTKSLREIRTVLGRMGLSLGMRV
jgi:DNA-directed RNA polymerase subunit alpha